MLFQRFVFPAMAVSALLLLGSGVAAATECDVIPVAVEHEIKLDAGRLLYTSFAGRVPIREERSQAVRACMFYTAYRVPSTNGQHRPVMFIWGGGPGGFSQYMNFEFAGPLRIDGAEWVSEGSGFMVNQETLLADTDLVFVDAVGTGYSRSTDSRYTDDFFGTIGDTLSFAEFIRAWRLIHDAEDSPVFIGGISWGGNRSGTVAYELVKNQIPLRGAMLMSGGMGLQRDKFVSPVLLKALDVVEQAQAAFLHGKTLPEHGSSVEEVAEAAEAWVHQHYAPSLEKADRLEADEKQEISQTLAGFIGVPVEQIDQDTLFVPPKQFRELLLREEGKVLYGSDVRMTDSIPMNWLPAAVHHIKYDLGYRTDLEFIDLNRDIFQSWNFVTSSVSDEVIEEAMARFRREGGGPPVIGEPLPAIEEAVGLAPELKVLVLSGRFDSPSACASHAETAANLPGPLKAAVTTRCFDGGHSIHRSIPARKGVSDAIKEMIRSATTG